MATQIKLRRDTASNWLVNNPILDIGEPGIEIDTRLIKFGDGINRWSSLAYAAASYTLPTATTDVIGGVKVDGSTITITDGTISSHYTLPTATISTLGAVRPDNSTVLINNGVLSAAPYSLPAATTQTLGGVKVDGVSITVVDGTISVANNGLPIASQSTLGGVKVDGTTISVSVNGTISVVPQATVSGNAGTVTNGVYTTGSYSNPSWITSLNGSKISGDITGNASNVSGTVLPTHGGTGLTVFTAGDLMYASGTSIISKLSIGALNSVLVAGASAPQYVAQSALSVGYAATSGTATAATNLAGGAGGSIHYQSASNASTFLALGTQNYVLVAGATAPQYTNKLTGVGINQRVVTIADGYAFTVNADTTDLAVQTCTQAAGTLTMNAPTGTPIDGQRFNLRIKSTNSMTFSWNSIFAGSSDLALPVSTSGAGATDYIAFIYNSTVSKWQIMGKNFGF